MRLHPTFPLPEREYVKSLDLKPLIHNVPAAWRPASVARHWGISKQSLYRLIKSGELKVINLGGAVRIPESEIVSYWKQTMGKM